MTLKRAIRDLFTAALIVVSAPLRIPPIVISPSTPS